MGVMVIIPMETQRQLAVRPTDRIFSGSATEAQHLVEVLAHFPAASLISGLKIKKNKFF